MSISKEFKSLFERDLAKLKEEITLFADEEKLWVISGSIKNTAGNLAMHLCGNLQHFIGHVLGGTDYKRQRAFEFEGRMSREALLKEIDQTQDVLRSFFEATADEDFQKDYPLEVFGSKMSCFYFISHLYGHLNYHLGQIDYHRRILAN